MSRPAPHAWSLQGHVIAGFIALAVLVGGFGTWSVTATIAGAVIAPGVIEVEENRQVIQHPGGGQVAFVAAREGEPVAAGDVILSLDGSDLADELALVREELQEVMARAARLAAERDGAAQVTFRPLLEEDARGDPAARDRMEEQRRLFASRRDGLEAEQAQLARRIDQITAQNRGLAAQLAALERQAELTAAELADRRELLAQGLTEGAEVTRLERDTARLEGERGELTAALAQNEGRITEIELQVLRLGSARREEAMSALLDLGARERVLREERRKLERRLERLDVRAPVAGRLHAMTVFGPGAVIRPAEPLGFVVPQGRPLVVAARVAATDIDEVRSGQAVTLRFAAFDGRTTPELTGEVLTVSADALTPDGGGAPYYLSRIGLAPGEQERLPSGLDLIPGMPVEAYIRTTSRSPLSYLVQPLANYFKRAFR